MIKDHDKELNEMIITLNKYGKRYNRFAMWSNSVSTSSKYVQISIGCTLSSFCRQMTRIKNKKFLSGFNDIIALFEV